MIQTILSIGLGFLVIVIATALGKKIISMFRLEATSEETMLFGGVTGVGVIGTLLFFLGVFHLYYKTIFLLVLLIAVCALYKEIIAVLKTLTNIIKDMSKQKSAILRICAVILFISIVGNFFVAVTPEIQWDSLVYHLTVPKIYAEEHAIVELVYDFHSYLPKQIDIVFVISETLQHPQAAKIFIYFFNLFLILGIYVFCKNIWNKETGTISATVLYTIPDMAIFQAATYNDIATALFLFFACMAFIKSKKQKSWLYICGFLIGLASGTKILAVSTLGFFALALCWRYGIKKQTIMESMIIGLTCLLALIPWLTMTAVQTGNPVYPFFQNMIGGEAWTPELNEFWHDLREDYGAGRSPKAFFLSPWNLSMYPMLYGSVYGYSPLFLIFIPLFFLRKKQQRVEWFFCSFILYYFIVWFMLASVSRYLYPVFPAVTILVATTMLWLWKKQGNYYEIIVPALLVSVLMTNMIMFGIIHRNTGQVLIGIETTDEYIQSYLQNYELMQWINANLDDNTVIFVVNDDRTYFLDREYIKGYPISQGYIDYRQMESANALAEQLKKEGVTHFMLTYHETKEGITLTPFPFKYNNQLVMIWTGLAEEHGELVREENNVYLYKLL